MRGHRRQGNRLSRHGMIRRDAGPTVFAAPARITSGEGRVEPRPGPDGVRPRLLFSGGSDLGVRNRNAAQAPSHADSEYFVE